MSEKPSLTGLAEDVVGLARERGLRLITAESCTAGALATLIADIPGAGDVLLGGFVTYAKACKSALLGIDPGLIAKHTAVSAEVAAAMAQGALTRCPVADVAVAVTCVGGPKPDEDGNPVGLTHIALCHRSGRTAAIDACLGGETTGHMRGEAMREALMLMRTFLADGSGS